jgi:RNA polymerase sigma-70 factor (ECF subfamily)
MPDHRDHRGFDAVVNAYYERILRGALSVTGDRHLAEDIVQETFLLAFRKFDSYSGESSVFTWLYAIMLNRFRMHWRKTKRRKRLHSLPIGDNPAWPTNLTSSHRSPYAELADSELSEWLIEAIYKLPVKLREVVAMHYFDDLTLNEVAAILKCRLATVKSRLFRSKERLRQTLRGRL